jgi:hypothetical protein
VIERFLAGRYAERAARAPLDLADVQEAGYAVDAFEALGLLDAERACAWRARVARWAQDWPERPLLPDELRRAAYEQVRPDGDALRVLEAVGALGWRDAGAVDDPALVIERVLVASPHAPGALTVSSIVLFDRAVRVHWYAAQALVDPDRSQLDVLDLQDDAETRYRFDRGGHTVGFDLPVVGASSYLPAPPPEATWLDVMRDGARVVRIELA